MFLSRDVSNGIEQGAVSAEAHEKLYAPVEIGGPGKSIGIGGELYMRPELFKKGLVHHGGNFLTAQFIQQQSYILQIFFDKTAAVKGYVHLHIQFSV